MALLVLACSDLLVPPAPNSPGPGPLSLSIAPASAAGGNAAAYDRGDRLAIRLLHADSTVLDTTLAITPASEETRLRLAVREKWAGQPLRLEVELRAGSSPLFRGATDLVLQDGENSAEVGLEPVPAGIRLPAGVPTVTSLGSAGQLTGAVLFATGDTVGGATLAWRSLNEDVLSVTRDGEMRALDEGSARVEGSFQGFADTLTVRVSAEVARLEVTPAEVTLRIGESRQLEAVARDARGNTLRRTFSWSSTAPDLATVEAGLVRGVRTGLATVTATAGGRSANSTVSVVNPEPTLSSVSPDRAVVGGPAFTLSVRGSGFVPTSSVHWNGSARPTEYRGPGELRVSIPASDLTSAGSATLTVTNPAPGGGSSSGVTLVVENPRPEVTSLSPSSATAGSAAIELTVTGSGFVSGSVVTWDGEALSTRYVSATELEAQVSANRLRTVATVRVGVRNPQPGGGISGTRSFRVVSPASIQLSEADVVFSTVRDAPAPAARTVGVTNGGDRPLEQLAVEVAYATGSGWLTATLDRPTAPATVTLRPSTTDLPEGSYAATVTVRSATPGIEARQIAVRYEVSETRVALEVRGGGYGSGSVRSTPDGLACEVAAGQASGPCRAVFTLGTAVVLTATAAAGSEFRGWAGACTGPTCRIVLDGARTVTARFESAGAPQAEVDQAEARTTTATLSGTVTLPLAEPVEHRWEVWPTAAPASVTPWCLASTTEPVRSLASSCEVTGLSAGTQYGYRLVARGVGSERADTASGTFTTTRTPGLLLSAATVGFTAVRGEERPDAQTVEVTNGGDGSLEGLSASITYSSGSGWLAATLSGATAPATLSLRPTNTTLEAGTYRATVTVSSTTGGVEPRALQVTYTVSEAPPQMLTLEVQGSGYGSGRVTSMPTGIACTVEAGVASGDCSASFPEGSTVTLSGVPEEGSEFRGCDGAEECSYTLTTSRTVTARFESASAPQAALGEPEVQTTAVSLTGTLTLGVAEPVEYLWQFWRAAAPDSVASWCEGSTDEPVTSQVLSCEVTDLRAGTEYGYRLVALGVGSERADTASGTFTTPRPPAILLSPDSVGFETTVGAEGAPEAATVQVTNGGGGVLDGLTATVSYASGEGWLSAALDAGTAPATLTLRPSTTELAPGTYVATVSIASDAATNSPQEVAVTYVVSPGFTYYRAEGNYQDSGSAGNHGSPAGTVGFGEGFSGQAFRFSGPGQPGQITAPERGGIATAEQVTVAGWVRIAGDQPVGGVYRFVTLQPERAVLRLDGRFGGEAGAGPNSLHFYVNTASGPIGLYADNALSRRGCWYHVAGTYDGSTARLYRNGEEVASRGGGGELNPGTGEGIKLSNADGSETLDGWLDEVRILSRVADAEEIAGWASAAGSGPVCSTAEPSAIVLSADSVQFYADPDDTSPAPRRVEVAEEGGGTLEGLSVSVSYADEGAPGWLTATLDDDGAPASIELRVDTAGLRASGGASGGFFSAEVAVHSPSAANSPQTFLVSLSYRDPEDCSEVLSTRPGAADGEYQIHHSSEEAGSRSYSVYCHGMEGGSPREYLTLKAVGDSLNYAMYYGSRNEQPLPMYSRYTRLRLDPRTLQVEITDTTFATHTAPTFGPGVDVTWMRYGTAADCVTTDSHLGRANMDLTGTPFEVSDSFVIEGYYPAGTVNGQPIQGATYARGQVIDLTGGGYCGGAHPVNGSLQLQFGGLSE